MGIQFYKGKHFNSRKLKSYMVLLTVQATRIPYWPSLPSLYFYRSRDTPSRFLIAVWIATVMTPRRCDFPLFLLLLVVVTLPVLYITGNAGRVNPRQICDFRFKHNSCIVNKLWSILI